MAAPFPFVAGAILTAAQLNEIEPQLLPDLGYYSATYFTAPFVSTSAANNSVVNTLVCIPFLVTETATFDRILIRSGGVITNPTTVRLGIYNNSATAGGEPSTLVLDAGTVSVTAINTIYEITISRSLTPGWYWLGAANQTAATTTQLVTITGPSAFGYTKINQTNMDQRNGMSKASITGAFPASTSGFSATPNGIFVALRKV